MSLDKFTYKEVESCLYEAMRTYTRGGVVQAEREGKACINPTLTRYNETYVHPCLRPLTRHGSDSGYVRGQAIADYHNSQVKSKLKSARMNGNDKQLSKAMGVVATLPKDYVKGIVPDLSEEEFNYLTKRVEAEAAHAPFKKDEELEKAIALKCNHEWTPNEREDAYQFLIALKDCILDEMAIADDDVLFWSIHFDESFPHLHLMVLPTCEKTYEKDVYSKKEKKDGSHTLLHKAGEVEKTYSVERFYETNYDGEYTFIQNFHPNVVRRMQEEKHLDAKGLLNQSTSEVFTVSKLNKQQREQSRQAAMEILALQKKVVELERQKAIAEAKANATQGELAKATSLLNEKETLLEEKEIEIEEMMTKVSAMRETIKELKEELSSLVKKVMDFVPTTIKYFIEKWAKAQGKVKRQEIDNWAKTNVEAKVELATERLKSVGARAEALMEDDMVSGINLATFERTPQKIGFATKQIIKVAEANGKAEAFDDEIMERSLNDWFDRSKYEPLLEAMTSDQAKAFMSNGERAKRAYDIVENDLEWDDYER